MVVTRKTPLVPPPPTSRTNSSQATPRTAKSKTQAVPTTLSVGDDSKAGPKSGSGNSNSGKGNPNDVGSSSHKHKSKSKSKKDTKKSPTSRITFGDMLVYLLLAYFTIYTIRVCPTDVNHESRICLGLAKYRQLVLDPYVFPVFHRALAHPSIVPHVKRVKPHFDTAVRIGKPIVRRTRVEWNSRIVPQWNKRVVPQWNKRVVPQWNKHVVPHLQQIDRMIEPYRSRITREYSRYSKRISPHLRTAKANLQRWQRQLQPYVILAATKTHDGYQAATPYAIPIWNRIKAGMKYLLLFAKDQRVQFVDPHVARIWEKVKELSNGKPKGSSTRWDEPAALRPAASLTEAEIITAEEVVPPMSSSSLSEAETTASLIIGSSTSTLVTSTTATESSTNVTESPQITSVTESEEFTSASSDLESTPPTTASSIVASSFEKAPLPSPDITGPSLITNEPAPTPLDAADEADIDLEEFARELGLDEPLTTAAATETTVPPPEETETEEQKAERLRLKEVETAEKRAEITGRHSKWESDLQQLVKAKKKSLRKALVTIRKPAAVELKENKKVWAAMDSVAAESEKYTKGAEAYLKTLKTDNKEGATKVAMWGKLIDKVDAKFRDRLTELDNIVNNWYMDVLDREAQEVQLATAEVKNLANDAQADLGIDYSWLGDVTYEDWQRYHDLIRVSENFTELATSIQKGTHPSPPINPVVDVLEELESEVENIVTSFETRLQQLKRDGEHALGGQADDAEMTTTTSTKEPTFSVLPVPEDEIDRESTTGNIPSVVIGRSEEEIVEAFSRVGEEGAEITAPRSVKMDPEDIVGSLAQDVSVEAERATSAVPAAGHVEL